MAEKLAQSFAVKQPARVPRAFQSASTVRMALPRSSAFSLANAISIGFRSGLWGGMNIRVAPAASIAGDLVRAKVIHDHDVVLPQRWSQNLLDIGQE
jgi:hypothetical protein